MQPEKTMIVYNPTSGKDKGESIAKKFQHYAEQNSRRTFAFTLKETTPTQGCADYAKQAVAAGYDNLIVIGGDGTLNHTVQGLDRLNSSIRLGIIPGGTVNNMAHALDLPLDFTGAADVILAGHTRKVDYGRINDRVVVSTVTIGLLADSAARITQKEKQTYGAPLFIERFAKLLLQKRKYTLSLRTDRARWHGKSQLVIITMTNSAGGYKFFDTTASVDDGLFHISILPKLNFYKLLLYLPKIIAGRISELPDIVYLEAKELSIAGQERSIGTRVDGDPGEKLPVTMQVVHKGLTIYAPQK